VVWKEVQLQTRAFVVGCDPFFSSRRKQLVTISGGIVRKIAVKRSRNSGSPVSILDMLRSLAGPSTPH
jgi:hypothetical protein